MSRVRVRRGFLTKYKERFLVLLELLHYLSEVEE